jgi:hypothetical protein
VVLPVCPFNRLCCTIRPGFFYCKEILGYLGYVFISFFPECCKKPLPEFLIHTGHGEMVLHMVLFGQLLETGAKGVQVFGSLLGFPGDLEVLLGGVPDLLHCPGDLVHATGLFLDG